MANCTICKRQQRVGEHFYVWPTPARTSMQQTLEERRSLRVSAAIGGMGMVALTSAELPLCTVCYLIEFGKCYPGEPFPILPDPPGGPVSVQQAAQPAPEDAPIRGIHLTEED